jgi:uncharacterized protein
MAYEWDRNKASSNQIKHGVTFEEAKSVFEEDFNALTLSDTEHSFEEERYIEIGMSKVGRLLSIVYTERNANIRIISARPATSREVRLYEQD